MTSASQYITLKTLTDSARIITENPTTTLLCSTPIPTSQSTLLSRFGKSKSSFLLLLIFRRNKYASTYPRPTSNWHYMCNGLCGSSTPSSSSSFYGNLASVGSSNYGNCDRYQPQDDDYLGNNAAIGIDRGHLIPNALMNQNEDASKATFTLTNVSPQYSTFNQQAWNQLECMVRKFMEEEINNQDVWILVGTYGKVGTMNGSDSSKNNVDIPEFYWHAFCYTGIEL